VVFCCPLFSRTAGSKWLGRASPITLPRCWCHMCWAPRAGIFFSKPPAGLLGRWRGCSQTHAVMALPWRALEGRQNPGRRLVGCLLASLASVWLWGWAGPLLRADAASAWDLPIGRRLLSSSPSGREPAVAAICQLEAAPAIDPKGLPQRRIVVEESAAARFQLLLAELGPAAAGEA